MEVANQFASLSRGVMSYVLNKIKDAEIIRAAAFLALQCVRIVRKSKKSSDTIIAASPILLNCVNLTVGFVAHKKY